MAIMNSVKLFTGYILNSRTTIKIPLVSVNKIFKAGLRKSVEESLGLPAKPKKPTPAFMDFIAVVRSQIQTQNPNISYKDIVKKCSHLWDQLDPKEKNKYELTYQDKYLEYSKQISIYKNSLSEEDLDAIKKEKLERTKQKKIKKIKLEAKKRGKPKHPLSSFALFVQTKMKNIKFHPNALNELARQWTDLKPEEKDEYKKLSSLNAEKYKEEIAVWEEKMVEEGHEELLRRLSSITETSPTEKKHTLSKKTKKEKSSGSVTDKKKDFS